MAKDRLPVFRLDALKAIVCAALDEARKSGSFLILAYVIMPDHLHVITEGDKKAARDPALHQPHNQPPRDQFSKAARAPIFTGETQT